MTLGDIPEEFWRPIAEVLHTATTVSGHECSRGCVVSFESLAMVCVDAVHKAGYVIVEEAALDAT